MLIGRGATLRRGYKGIIVITTEAVRVRTATSTWSGAAAAAATAVEPPFAKRPSSPFHRSSVMAASEDDSQSQTHIASSRQNASFTKGKSRPSTKKPRSDNNNKRPTHFVCLPLVTGNSIPQLSESLAYFRSVTTTEPVDGDGGGARRKGKTTEAEPDYELDSRAQQHGSDVKTGSGSGNGRRDDTLRLIPPAAHRPPGTFHLTLGAMDLSDPRDLERALRLLESIDYLDLLAEAGMSVGDNRGVGTRSGDRKVEGSTEHPPRPTIDDEGRNEDPKVDGQGGNGGGPIEATRTILSKPLQSLSRAISPPPTSRTLDKDDVAAQTSLEPKQKGRQRRQERSSPTTLTLTLHGLGTFPRASSSRVFFAHADEDTGRLLPFGKLVRQRFRDAGLVAETRPLVLHATVANLIYVKGKSKGRGIRGRGEEKTVDARDILRYFNDGKAVQDRVEVQDRQKGSLASTTTPDSTYIWARDIVVDRIRICRMGAERSELEGWGMEYKPVGEKLFGS